LHPSELTVCCRLIRFSWHGASCPREIWRFSTVSLPEVQKKRGADVDFQAVWAHVSNQEYQVSPRGASDWWRKSVRKSVSVHQDKIRASAIQQPEVCGQLQVKPLALKQYFRAGLSPYNIVGVLYVLSKIITSERSGGGMIRFYLSVDCVALHVNNTSSAAG